MKNLDLCFLIFEQQLTASQIFSSKGLCQKVDRAKLKTKV